jgi:hypothetical protein
MTKKPAKRKKTKKIVNNDTESVLIRGINLLLEIKKNDPESYEAIKKAMTK